jgi:hypothetical protein
MGKIVIGYAGRSGIGEGTVRIFFNRRNSK